MQSERAGHLAELTAEIVSAYVQTNKLEQDQLGYLVSVVHRALAGAPAQERESGSVAKTPAVSIRESVTRDYIVCLEDGRKFRSLKRHLAADHGFSAEAYRARWKLPADYPMVPPAYSSTRSDIAKLMGLGRGRHRVEPTA